MFVFWEMTSLDLLPIGFNSTSAEARKAALQSLVITAGGGFALFGGLLIGMEAGTFSLMAITQDPALVSASPWFGVHPRRWSLIGAFYQVGAVSLPLLASERLAGADAGVRLSAFGNHGEARRLRWRASIRF
ncbi:MAG: hypothetical protein HPM95_06390 [Alphaproteobacteria bacterium]|nr:hypothetical protein [Alphaproteobacteria bacterium]